MEELVLCKQTEWGAIVTINRPQALNALNLSVLDALNKILERLDDDPAIRAVILTGAGDRAFVAGADIAAMSSLAPSEARAFSTCGQKVMSRIGTMRSIVIGAINGYALGGGCELAMACDIRIASQKAKFGIPEVTLGVLPGFGGTQRLPRLVGLGKALELAATGSQISAEEAYRIGLVNQVVPPEELLRTSEELAHKIATNSGNAVALAKQGMTTGSELDLNRGLEYEAGLFALAFAHEDQHEGMAAFLEKRPAKFRG